MNDLLPIVEPSCTPLRSNNAKTKMSASITEQRHKFEITQATSIPKTIPCEICGRSHLLGT